MSIDCGWNQIPNLFTEKNIYSTVIDDTELLHCFCFLDKLCAEKVISLCLFAYKLINENYEKCTMMYRMSMTNGIDCCNNQTNSLLFATTLFVEWD